MNAGHLASRPESFYGTGYTFALLNRLGLAIVNGEFDRSGLPNERQLCLQLSVSRTVIREVVKMLTAKGVVRSKQKNGLNLQPRSEWNIFDPDVTSWMLIARPEDTTTYLKGLCRIVDVASVSLAIKALDNHKADMVAAYRRIDAARSPGDLADSRRKFHTTLWATSHNPYLDALGRLMAGSNIYAYPHDLETFGIDTLPYYLKLLTAIKNGDEASAAAAMANVTV